MVDTWGGLLDRYAVASEGFARRLASVAADRWGAPTPCTEWSVRQLVNHMTQANLSYARLLRGGTREEFLRRRDQDALGTDPVAAYARSVRECAAAFAEPGALEQVLDHPLGPVVGRQALAVRTTDSAIHTWDLARAIGEDEALDPGLVAWIDEHLDEIYAGLPEMPASAESTHRFFAAPPGGLAGTASRQERLLDRMGRKA